MQQEQYIENMKKLIKLHPNPTRLLYKHLAATLDVFTPSSLKEATGFMVEHLMATTSVAAGVLAIHAKDHPEEAKECVPDLAETLPKLFSIMLFRDFAIICKKLGLINPLAEPSVNEKTRDEILEDLKRGSLHG